MQPTSLKFGNANYNHQERQLANLNSVTVSSQLARVKESTDYMEKSQQELSELLKQNKAATEALPTPSVLNVLNHLQKLNELSKNIDNTLERINNMQYTIIESIKGLNRTTKTIAKQTESLNTPFER